MKVWHFEITHRDFMETARQSSRWIVAGAAGALIPSIMTAPELEKVILTIMLFGLGLLMELVLRSTIPSEETSKVTENEESSM